MDRAAYLRGRYLTSYAQCEFLLADLSVRVDNRFRYALDKRINAAKAMTEASGPLNAYAADFLPLIENIGTWSERRHWLAHGFMTIFTDPVVGMHSSSGATSSGRTARLFSSGSPPSTICRTLWTRLTGIAQHSSPMTAQFATF